MVAEVKEREKQVNKIKPRGDDIVSSLTRG